MRNFQYNFSNLFKIALIPALAFIFSSCVISGYKTPDLPPWQVATIKTDKPEKIRVHSIDGLSATGTLNGEKAREFPGTVIVTPGLHVIVPCYLNADSEVIYGDPLRFYTQQEQDYIIRHKVKWNKNIRFWVENNGVDITTEY